MLMFPHEFDAAVSTHGLVPGNLRCTVGLELPPTWLGDMMASDRNRMTLEFVRYAALILPAAGGAVLMNHFGGGLGAAFGALLGSGLGLAFFFKRRLTAFNVEGGGGKLQVQLEAAVKNAEDAKKLAGLAVEASLLLANLPRGEMDGGAIDAGDPLRRAIATRLDDIVPDREESSRFAAVDDPFISRRIIMRLILSRVQTAEGGQSWSDQPIASAVATLCRSQKGSVVEPAEIERVIAGSKADTPAVRDAIDFYREWHASSARLFFTVDNLGRMSPSGE